MSQLPHVTSDLQQLTHDIDVHGFCLIPRALDEATLSDVRARITAQAEAELRAGVKYSNPGHESNQWVNMLLNKGAVFEHLVTHPLASRVVEHLLGEAYLISCCDAQIKHPGDPAMPLHTDQWWMPPPVVPGQAHVRPGAMQRKTPGSLNPNPAEAMISPPAVANIMWMISDFTAENGATVVVPGSHLSGTQPDSNTPHRVKTFQAVGKAGTALIFDGRIWHAAENNRSNGTRYGITCTFCGPQFRQLENYTRGLRPEVVERASPALLKRLGFKAWSTYGHTGDPSLDCSVAGDSALGVLGD